MAKKKEVYVVKEEPKKNGGCLSKIVMAFFILLFASIILGGNDNDTSTTPTATAKATAKATATPTQKPTEAPTSTPTVTPTATSTEIPSPTPAVPGTYRPGIEGTNAYDVTVAMKEVGIEPPKRQSVQDGYLWMSETYKEGNVSYSIEIETTKDYRVTTMQVMMSGGNNNFVWWAAACVFGENAEQVLWLKDNMWNENATTKTFADDVWTIFPLPKGVMLTIEHIDAEKWYMSLI